MGAAEQRTFTHEDTMRALNDRATKDGDTFLLKVFRRINLAMQPTVIATFEGASVGHFTSPELWLPQLAGGGKFMLMGYHATEPNRPIGSFLTFPIDSEDARDVDMQAPKKAGWRGPVELIFPKEADRRPATDMPLYGIGTPPPAPGPGDSATRHAWPRSAGGGFQRENYDDAAFGPRAGALEAERRKLEAEKLDAERDRHKAQLEMRETAHKAEMAALKSELMGEFRAARAPTGPDPIVEFMKMQAEERKAADARAAEDRRIAETRATEDRRLAEARQERADARFEKLLEKMSERPKENPLELAKQLVELTGKKSNDSDALVKTVHNMVDMQTSTMGMAMDFVDHVSRMQLGGGGESEPSWVKGVDRLMKGIGKMALARPPAPPPGAAQQPQQVPQAQPGQSNAQQPQQPRPPQAETNLPVIDQVDQAIRAHYEPKEVAKALIAYYKDESVQRALAEAGGDPEAALMKRLGNWPNAAPQNAEYLKRLLAELERQLQAAGFFADDSAEVDEADDEGDEDEAGDEAVE